MTALVILFSYLLLVLPVSVGTGIWMQDDPDMRRSPGLLGFASLAVGFLWPVALPISLVAWVCIVFGEWVKDYRR